MCGRYAASARNADLVEEFDVEDDQTGAPSRSILVNPQDPPAGEPDFNMAPSKQARVVVTRRPRARACAKSVESAEATAEPTRQLRLLTWGLVPSWAKDVRVGMRLINARAESVLAKPAFARAAATRRALVPAQGWYEWQVSPTATDTKGKARKQPFYVHRRDGAGLAIAGLYEFWRDPAVPDGDDPSAWLSSFAVITTAAEPGLDRIHDRQPLILERGDWAAWLDPARTGLAEVESLLGSAAPGRFAAYPVGSAVGSSRSSGPGLIAPADIHELRGVVDPMTGEIIG